MKGFPHAALADLFKNFVMRERFAEHEIPLASEGYGNRLAHPISPPQSKELIEGVFNREFLED